MKSRHRQRQLATCNTQQRRGHFSKFKSMPALVLGPNRSTDPVQDSPPRQSRRPGSGLPITSVEARLHLPKAKAQTKVLQRQTSLKRPACPTAAVLAGQPCTSPTASWDAATRTPERPDRPVSETSIYRKNRDQRVLRVSFFFFFPSSRIRRSGMQLGGGDAVLSLCLPRSLPSLSPPRQVLQRRKQPQSLGTQVHDSRSQPATMDGRRPDIRPSHDSPARLARP